MPKPTTRRLLQQAKHCIEEALAVCEVNEDTQATVDDCLHAVELLDEHIIPELRALKARQESIADHTRSGAPGG